MSEVERVGSAPRVHTKRDDRPEMSVDDFSGIRALGYFYVHSQVDTTGVIVYLMSAPSGRFVAMLAQDISDVAAGREGHESIEAKDRSAHLPHPWSVVRRPPTTGNGRLG